jgi:hypothetical protein
VNDVIAVTDFVLDRKTLRGNSVAVAGTLQVMGDMAILKNGMMDMSGAFIDFQRVSREQRKNMIERCNMGCDVVVRGRVGDAMMEPGIFADTIEVR